MGKSDDIVFRNILISNPEQARGFLCYVSGLANIDLLISQHIIKTLTQSVNRESSDTKSLSGNTFESIKNNILSITDLNEIQSMKDVVDEILSGKTALFIDTYGKSPCHQCTGV